MAISSANTRMSAVSDASLVSSLSALSVGGPTPLPPVRLIPFDIFKQLGQMPRCPENRDILVNYEDTIRDESLYIFMSHCWLRGWSGAPGWDGRPHPDTSNHDKYQLMVAAVEKIMSSLTTMSKCYIWLDFGCIDQDAAACDELRMLDKIVGVCDLILTNVHDCDYLFIYLFIYFIAHCISIIFLRIDKYSTIITVGNIAICSFGEVWQLDNLRNNPMFFYFLILVYKMLPFALAFGFASIAHELDRFGNVG